MIGNHAQKCLGKNGKHYTSINNKLIKLMGHFKQNFRRNDAILNLKSE